MKISPLLPLTLFCAVLLPCTGLAQIVPILPNINTSNNFNVTNALYGATTSSTDNSAAIQAAIIAAAAASGGGTVEIPGPGTYMSRPISMRKQVDLQIDAGATLKFLAESNYPNATGSPAYCISGTNLTDVEISGSGTIDGNGAGWWKANPPNRPYMVYLNKCMRVLYQGVTLQNPPKMHIVFKNWMGNVTIQGITINTTAANANNTDGIDLIGTNCLIQNCSIAAGDDNIAIGSSTIGAIAAGILVTNCSFGVGHGMTIGSNTEGGVSNLTVINCSFNGTQNGIRLKSDNASTGGGGQGGPVQNIFYYNLTMTNILFFPIAVSSYYNEVDPPIITVSQAAGTNAAPVTGTTVSWQNIVISNLYSTYTSGHNNSGLIIWGRTELPVTNFTLIDSSIKSSSTFGIYNAYGVQIVDSQIIVPSGTSAYTLYNAGVTISNTAAAAAVAMDGLTSANSLALYDAPATFSAPDVLGENPITVSGCILSNTTSLTLGSADVVNFTLGSTPATVVVTGSLELDSPTLNIATNTGFGAGTYALFSYTSNSSSITPVLGTTPAGFNYTLTNDPVALQVNLLVTSTNVVSGTGPTITNQPAGQGFYTGENATLVSGASGTALLMYQWYFNTNNILAAGTNSSLILTNLQTTNAGAYDVIVTNASGSATSAVANLTVILPPKFASTVLNGSSLLVSGNGGLPNSNYVVLSTTNVALPVSQWTRLAANPFDGSGNFNFTNATGTNTQGYFRMQLP